MQDVIERSVLMTSEPILADVSFMSTTSSPIKETTTEEVTRVKTIAEMERDHILAVLRKCKGRISGSGGAAELLRLPASTLKSKMKKLGIEKIYKE
ncbi:MAG TPA: helix-turn-helix domain-containing protein [Puia sp.]|nr:helix-turn-helix domain-containing protein [Puia sp.]